MYNLIKYLTIFELINYNIFMIFYNTLIIIIIINNSMQRLQNSS